MKTYFTFSFAECSNNTYGKECANTCDCVNSNAIVSSQSCNHVTGICECRNTWTGTRCETDVDECALGTSNCDSLPNRGCHNTIDGFQCSCFVGYETDNSGNCSESRFSPGPSFRDSLFLSLFCFNGIQTEINKKKWRIGKKFYKLTCNTRLKLHREESIMYNVSRVIVCCAMIEDCSESNTWNHMRKVKVKAADRILRMWVSKHEIDKYVESDNSVFSFCFSLFQLLCQLQLYPLQVKFSVFSFQINVQFLF